MKPQMVIAMGPHQEIRALRRRIEELETLFGITEARKFQLPIKHRGERLAIVLTLLLNRELVSRTTILLAIGKDETARKKSVDVYVCHTRKILKGWGITLRTDWGRGWYVERKDRPALRARLAACNPNCETALPRAAA